MPTALPASLLLLCTSLLLACGEQSSDAGAEGSSTQVEPTSDGGVTGSESTDTEPQPTTFPSDETGVLPADCVDTQGSGPCMVEVQVEVPSSDVVFGDFNDDGHIDILARSDGTGPDDADELVLFPGVQGVFGVAQSVPFADDAVANGRAVSLAALRPTPASTAKTNVFVQGTYGALGDIEVDVWWLQGGELTRFYDPTPAPPAGPWFGDFDGDGSSDLVFSPDGSTLDTLELHTCAATTCAAQDPVASSGAPAGPWTILGADTTGDGSAELLVVRTGDDGLEVVVLSNDGNGFSNLDTLVLGNDLNSASSRLADINGDGRLDLMLTDTGGDPLDNSYATTLHAFVQDGDGGFEPGPVIEAGERVTGYAIADFSLDGVPDIALRRSDRSIVNIGEGPGFTDGVAYELTGEATGLMGQSLPLWTTDVVDVEGDGDLDVLTVVGTGPQTFAVSLLRAEQ